MGTDEGGGIDMDSLAVAYLGRALRWGEKMSRRIPDPGIDWEQVAIDGLFAALRRESSRPESARSGNDFGVTLGKLIRRQQHSAMRSRRRKPSICGDRLRAEIGDTPPPGRSRGGFHVGHDPWEYVADPRGQAEEAIRLVDLADEVENLMGSVLTPAERRAAEHILAGGKRFGPENEAINKALCRARKRLCGRRKAA